MMARNSVAYDEDFFAWTQEQAQLLRAGDLAALDLANLAEEIDSVGRSDRREIRSRLTVLLIHLLKYGVQSKRRSPSWSNTIREQRDRIELVLADSPSLRPFVPEIVSDCFRTARRKAAEETRLPEDAFPELCPFTPAQILDEKFLPEPVGR